MLIYPCTKTLHGVTCDLSNDAEHQAFLAGFRDVKSRLSTSGFKIDTTRAEWFASLSRRSKEKVAADYMRHGGIYL
jgi:hypothetical protein